MGGGAVYSFDIDLISEGTTILTVVSTEVDPLSLKLAFGKESRMSTLRKYAYSNI